MSDSTVKEHMPALDGLRGVAILMVIASHTTSGLFGALSLYRDTTGVPHSFDIPRWLDWVASSGYHGVTLFFIVSAFTLARQMNERGLLDLKGYALRRVFRIGPGLWLAGFAYMALLGFGPRLGAPSGLTASDLAANFAFMGWLSAMPALAVVPGSWSVQTEVIFYLLLPAMIFVSRRRIWLLGIVTLLWIVAAQVSARRGMVEGWFTYEVYVEPLYQLPVFLIGVLAALAMPRLKTLPPSARHVSIGLLAFAILLMPFNPLRSWWLLLGTQFSIIGAVVTMLASVHPPRLLTGKLITSVGTVSYSMYLVHFALLWPSYTLASFVMPGNGRATLAVYFCSVAGVAFLISRVTYRWIEQPPRRWIAARLRRSSVMVDRRAGSGAR